jgi:hypothetical protein
VKQLELVLMTRSSTRAVSIDVTDLVIAGWTARDTGLLEAHIHELEALGIPRPSSTPLFYRVSAALLTQRGSIQVLGAESTGEVEAVLYALNGQLWVGVGSDHTDRALERVGVAAAKQCCPKPIGRQAWALAEVIDHWDELVLKSYVTRGATRELYQEGTLVGLHEPHTLIERCAGNGKLADGTAMFCGTLPVRGPLRGGERFEIELSDPMLDRALVHAYDVIQLPIVS